MDSQESLPSTTLQSTEPTPSPSPSQPPQSSPPLSSTPPIPEISPSPPPNPNSNPNPMQNPNQATQQSQTPLQQQSTPQPLQPIMSQFTPLQQQHSTSQHSQPIMSQLGRPHPPPSYSQFTSHLSSVTSPSTTPLSPSISPMQRGVAIGVPAHHSRPSQPTSFSSFGHPYNQQFSGFQRNSVNLPDSNPNQVKQPVPGIQSIGMMGSLSSGSQMRPSGMAQQKILQQSMKAQMESLGNQKFQGHGLLRAQSMVSPSGPSPGTPQNSQPPQSWRTSAPETKQMHPSSLPSTSSRQSLKPQSLQQRAHPSQPNHHPVSTSQQQMASAQQQQPPSQESQEQYEQQFPAQKIQHSMPQQQQAPRGPGPGNQKILAVVAGQQGIVQSGTANLDAGESGDHILGKRCIRELVSQVDPLEKLDPEVEDILIEIAEDFVDSITTFGCSLAKHRKSAVLEAKDILLHLERNWNMTLPGFGGEEIKSYKKQCTSDVHKERLAAVKKSMAASDVANPKSSAGQGTGNAKGHATKPPATGSPKGT